MYSLKELYRSGLGPSSSHTIGPSRAGQTFQKKHANATNFRVILQGSLAATGKGHFTDKALESAFEGYPLEIVWDTHTWPEQHPNSMILEAYHKDGSLLESWHVFSVGGGALVNKGDDINVGTHIYPHQNFTEVLEYCKKENISLPQYVERFDSEDIWEYLEDMRKTMMNAIETGLANTDTYLPAPIKVSRRAIGIYQKALKEENPSIKENGLISAYAHAVSEQNASMGEVVTAPTCGACGVMPAVLRYMQEIYNKSDKEICEALAVAGIIGLVAKHNASISGAEAGCQAEVGVACSMAAGAAAYLLGYDNYHIENAAEIGMEHHLGMTCDPIGGYVLIPCIERNANAAVRAMQTAYYVALVGDQHVISYDEVLQTMFETGKDMQEAYRETSIGGLAKYYERKLQDQSS